MTDRAVQLAIVSERRAAAPVRRPLAVESLLEQAPWTPLPVLIDGVAVSFEMTAFRAIGAGDDEVLVLRHGPSTAAAGGVALVRVHSGCVTGDIFHSLRCDCHAQLQRALRSVAASAWGYVVYVPAHEGRGIGLFQKVRAYGLQDQGFDTLEANREIGEPADGRDYRTVAEALRLLGLSSVRLMTNNPAKVTALEARGIAVVERVAVEIPANPHNQRYLKTKRDRMAHVLSGTCVDPIAIETDGDLQ